MSSLPIGTVLKIKNRNKFYVVALHNDHNFLNLQNNQLVILTERIAHATKKVPNHLVFLHLDSGTLLKMTQLHLLWEALERLPSNNQLKSVQKQQSTTLNKEDSL